MWAEGAQHRLELEGEAPPKKKASRLAMACGFSLPADTAVHAFDRVGLQRLCGDGARVALRAPQERVRTQSRCNIEPHI